ncbi:hypothetical protein SYNPS1DRAFT_30233 [Syncephalis pseudoplumigaleata]|uniref:RING-CH-type domain-containing protein n=1 Tax=Syncephalis pseudoplumigaleata TaxID=1712513 RepID=A0A4P9YVZ0_9FUNG|nr:hypothetical protein SYNPS1DRAFT_30233 [Syncephalis pseudoplumigaleata]|eukprot:RKP23995.1 hypothetical protein SYNPS1DRAFT_30233 [Syncephalis pseudoplumigaleata]
MSQARHYEQGARARRAAAYPRTRTTTANEAAATSSPDMHEQQLADNNNNNTQTDIDTQYEWLSRTTSMLHQPASQLDRDWSQLTSEGFGAEQPTATAATTTTGFTFHDPPATYLNEAPPTRHRMSRGGGGGGGSTARQSSYASSMRRAPPEYSGMASNRRRHRFNKEEEEEEETATDDDGEEEANTTYSSTQNISQYSADGHGSTVEGMRMGSLLMEPTLHQRIEQPFPREDTMAEYTEGDSSLLADHSALIDQDMAEDAGEHGGRTTMRRRHPLATTTTTTMPPNEDGHSNTATASTPTTASNEQQCRICFAGVEEVELLGRLISPCLCKGTMRYVHLECLNSWRNTSQNQAAFWTCTECGYRYSFARTKLAAIIQHPATLILMHAGGTVTLFLLSVIVFIMLTVVAGYVAKLMIRASLGGDYRLLLRDDVLHDAEHHLLTDADGNVWRRMHVGDFDDEGGGQLMLVRTRQEEADRLVRLANREHDDDEGSLFDLLDDPVRLEQALYLTTLDWFHMVLGLVMVGIIGFLQFIFGVAFVGPIPLFGGLHIRTTGLQRGGGSRRNGVDLLLLIVLVVGILRAFWTIYKSISTFVQRRLERLGQRILDVPKND